MYVYVLKYYKKEQYLLDGYVEAIFLDNPTFEDLKRHYDSRNTRHPTPISNLYSSPECFGRLASVKGVWEYGKSMHGGDYWVIDEMEIY